jgi:hypothetical protein
MIETLMIAFALAVFLVFATLMGLAAILFFWTYYD